MTTILFLIRADSIQSFILNINKWRNLLALLFLRTWAGNYCLRILKTFCHQPRFYCIVFPRWKPILPTLQVVFRGHLPGYLANVLTVLLGCFNVFLIRCNKHICIFTLSQILLIFRLSNCSQLNTYFSKSKENCYILYLFLPTAFLDFFHSVLSIQFASKDTT